MNLEELRSARRTERDRDGLQSLRDSFYRDVAAYLGDLKAERERAAEAADDPFSDPEVRRLTEEIETAEEVVQSIYERRVGKVVDRASFAAADKRHETEGLTAEEQELFDDLVGRIEQNRERVLDALDPDADGADAAADGEANTGTDAPDAGAQEPGAGGPEAGAGPHEARAEGGTPADETDPDAPDPNDLLAEAMGGAGDGAAGDDPTPVGSETTDGGVPTGAAPDDASPSTDDGTSPPAGGGDTSPTAEGDRASPSTGRGSAEPDGGTSPSTPETDRRTVYVTQDVGEIFGVDERTYSLAAEDVVDLPTDNAQALVERDAAEPIE
jgi:DNA replication factor GINS